MHTYSENSTPGWCLQVLIVAVSVAATIGIAYLATPVIDNTISAFPVNPPPQ